MTMRLLSPENIHFQETETRASLWILFRIYTPPRICELASPRYSNTEAENASQKLRWAPLISAPASLTRSHCASQTALQWNLSPGYLRRESQLLGRLCPCCAPCSRQHDGNVLGAPCGPAIFFSGGVQNGDTKHIGPTTLGAPRDSKQQEECGHWVSIFSQLLLSRGLPLEQVRDLHHYPSR